jgi:hypothetical protein
MLVKQQKKIIGERKCGLNVPRFLSSSDEWIYNH